MKTSDLTQAELKELHDDKKVIVFAYRTIFDLKYFENTQTFGLVKRIKKSCGLPYTGRSRFIALNADDADRLIHA